VGERLTVIRKNSQGSIRPGSKTGESYKRTVYLPAPVAADLSHWRDAGEGGLIFGRRDGDPWTKNDWDNWRSRIRADGKRGYSFKQAAEDTGLGTTLKPYDLRHTAASLYAASGWQAVEIAAQLGHSPAESQRTYQHIIVSNGSKERRTIEDYIAEARSENVRAREESERESNVRSA
jgi:integrase